MNIFKALAFVTPLLAELVPVDQVEEAYISSQEITLNQSLEQKGWNENLEKAFKLSEESSKPLLLAFVGSSWCPWSEKLEEEVLVQSSFVAILKEEFILARVELPENYSQFTAESLPSLKYLEQYQIEQCPSLVIVEPNGKKVATIHDLSLSASDYAKHIQDIFRDFCLIQTMTQNTYLKELQGEEIKTLYAKAGRLADSAFKKATLRAGLKADKSSFFLTEKYEDLALRGKLSQRLARKLKLKIARRDPKNQQGSQLKLALVDFRMLSEENKKQSKQVIFPLVHYLEKYGEWDREHAWKVEMMISKYLFKKNEFEGALQHARDCYQKAPESAKEEITSTIEYIKTQLQ